LIAIKKLEQLQIYSFFWKAISITSTLKVLNISLKKVIIKNKA